MRVRMRVRPGARTGAGTRQSAFSIGGAESHAANAKGSSVGADGPPPALFSLRGEPAYDEPSAAAAAAAAATAATTVGVASLLDVAGRLAELQADVAAPLGGALANVASGGGGADGFREEAATGGGAGSAGVGAAGAGAARAGAGAANEELLLKSCSGLSSWSWSAPTTSAHSLSPDPDGDAGGGAASASAAAVSQLGSASSATARAGASASSSAGSSSGVRSATRSSMFASSASEIAAASSVSSGCSTAGSSAVAPAASAATCSRSAGGSAAGAGSSVASASTGSDPCSSRFKSSGGVSIGTQRSRARVASKKHGPCLGDRLDAKSRGLGAARPRARHANATTRVMASLIEGEKNPPEKQLHGDPQLVAAIRVRSRRIAAPFRATPTAH